MTTQNEISREKRSLPPADYSLKIESFSKLKDSTVDRFESGVFKSGGYNWRLVFYPKGNQKADGKGHLSLYLKIDDAANSQPNNGAWEVNIYYKLFTYDQLSNQYLVVQDAAAAPVRRFNKNKSEWGFGKFLDVATFEEPSNGYLVDDTCVFGAEVYVVKQTGTEEIFSFATEPPAAADRIISSAAEPPAADRIQKFSITNPAADRIQKFSIPNSRTEDQQQHRNDLSSTGERIRGGAKKYLIPAFTKFLKRICCGCCRWFERECGGVLGLE